MTPKGWKSSWEIKLHVPQSKIARRERVRRKQEGYEIKL